MRLRVTLAAVLTTLTVGVVAIPAATAQPMHAPNAAVTPAPLLKVHHVTGKAHNGKLFKGRYDIRGYVVHNKKVYALGTVTGWLGKRHVVRNGVMVPASLTGQGSSSSATMAQNSCTILHLVLAPIHLNLLGLNVTLGGGLAGDQPIVLDITAQQGPNNLLGNLLCSLTGLLNQNGALAQLASNLNQLAATLTSLSSLLGAL
jgi:hypothetical protein